MLEGLRTGLYLHYKGGTYTVLFLAETHNHNGDIDVVYISHTYGKACTRPLVRDSRDEDSWTDDVKWPDGLTRKRFVCLEDLPRVQREVLQWHWKNNKDGT